MASKGTKVKIAGTSAVLLALVLVAVAVYKKAKSYYHA
jgi:hypothetical protein